MIDENVNDFFDVFKNQDDLNKIIKEEEFIYKIIKNNVNNQQEKLKSFPLSFLFSNKKNINKNLLIQHLRYISDINQNNYKQLLINQNFNISDMLLHLTLYFIERRKEKLLFNLFKIIKKLYTSRYLKYKDLLIIVKFLLCLCFISRNDLVIPKAKEVSTKKQLKFIPVKKPQDNFLKNIFMNTPILNSSVLDFSITYIKTINDFELTYDYIEFLQEIIGQNNSFKYLLISKIDIIEILYLHNLNNSPEKYKKILNFLTEIYAFHFNNQLISFIATKITNIYSNQLEKVNKNKLFSDLSTSISFLHSLHKYETKEIERDSYMINRGYLFNNTETNGIYIENIEIKNKFTLLFSFKLMPLQNNNSIKKEYPLLNFLYKCNSKYTMSFFIRNNSVYHYTVNHELIRLCNVKNNYSYLVYYEAMNNKGFTVHIKGQDKNFEFKSKNNSIFYGVELDLHIGKNKNDNYEGIIGPVILLKKSFIYDEKEQNTKPDSDNIFKKSFFDLKGNYERLIYLFNKTLKKHNTVYIYNQNYRYDYNLNYNYKTNIDEYNNLIKAMKYFKGKELNKSILCYFRPLHESCLYDKTRYTIENRFMYFYTQPDITNNSTFGVQYDVTFFSLIKFADIQFILLCYEMICAGLTDDNLEKDNEIIISFLFKLLEYTASFIFMMNGDIFQKEIKLIMFSIGKTLIKSSKFYKLKDKNIETISKFIIDLESKNENYSKNIIKYHNVINNYIYKILLDINLYSNTDFTSMIAIVVSFKNYLMKNKKGINTLEYFELIVNYSKFFEVINQNKLLKKQKDFKELKNSYLELINTFIDKVKENNNSIIKYFHKLIDVFMPKFDEIDYRKYQFIKLFYYLCEYFFAYIQSDERITILKYFIDLYKELSSIEGLNDDEEEITINDCKKCVCTNLSKKQIKILMCICIRMVLDYPPTNNFYDYSLRKNKRKRHSIFEKRNNKYDNEISEETNLFKTENENIEIDNENNFYYEKNDLNANPELSKSINNYTDNRKESINFEGNSDNKYFSKESPKDVKLHDIDQYKHYVQSSMNLYSRMTSNKIIPAQAYTLESVQNPRRMSISNKNSYTNLSSLKDSDYLSSNSSNSTTYYYGNFELFSWLLSYLSKSTNLNDYIVKSILLLLLENVNNLKIENIEKIRFITKKSFFIDICSDRLDNKLSRFLYYNKEISYYFNLISIMIQNNKSNLTDSFEFFIYILISICKNREENKCPFNHITTSRKISGKIFLNLLLNNNKTLTQSFLNLFPTLCNCIIPYITNNFMYDFIYNVIMNIDPKISSSLLSQTITYINFEKTKYFFSHKINVLKLILRILNSNEYWDINRYNLDQVAKCNYFEIKEEEIKILFDEELITSKYNVYNSNDKEGRNSFPNIYVNLFYKMLIKLSKRDKKNKKFYIQMLLSNFITTHSYRKDILNILYYIDSTNYKKNINIEIEKMYKNNSNKLIDIPCVSILILVKSLKYYSRFKVLGEDEIKNYFTEICVAAFQSIIKLFNEFKISKSLIKYKLHESYSKKQNEKSYKLSCVYNKLLNVLIKEIKYNKGCTIKVLLNNVAEYNSCRLIGDISNEENLNEENNNLNLNDIKVEEVTDIDKDTEIGLNDSFCSCNSTKSQKNLCLRNHKIKFDLHDSYLNLNIYSETNSSKEGINEFNVSNNKLSNEDKQKIIMSADKNEDKRLSTNDVTRRKSTTDLEIKANTDNEIENELQIIFPSVVFNNLIKNGYQNNPFELSLVQSFKQMVMFPKNNLLKKNLGIYFKDLFFYDKYFCIMKQYFKYSYEKFQNINYPYSQVNKTVDIENFLTYPSIIKNYTPDLFYFKGLFLRKDFDFFDDEYFYITHPYFMSQSKNVKNNSRIFPKKSKADYDLFLTRYYKELNGNNKSKNVRKYYCELNTDKNIIFGELLVTNEILYFHNIDKEEFSSSLKSDKEKLNYILCSNSIDYSKRDKKIFIFINEINEIFSRRFLYKFQAIEVFLKNGKSYYFNLITVDQQKNLISFISSNPNINIKSNKSNLKIITDQKTEFKNRNYVNYWLNGNLSNLTYLLLINKYSSRSYNDTTQFPVMPWILLNNGTLRDLRYPISAQNEPHRGSILAKYDTSPNKFKNHYNIHYSNPSFVTFYLFRIQPFTNNQINLQNNKFEAPNRQFSSINESLKIFEQCNDCRELIPHFFINIEFYYNLNCNFFGFCSNAIYNRRLVHNFFTFNNDKNKYQYLLENIKCLNSIETKKNLNIFIDNVFGCDQISKREDLYIFDKYCYEQNIDLSKTISKYLLKNYDYEKIKKKIDAKINRILCFGQTPYQLFSVNHPIFGQLNETTKKNSKNVRESFVDASIRFSIKNTNFVVLNNVTDIEGKSIDNFMFENKVKIKEFENKIVICKMSKDYKGRYENILACLVQRINKFNIKNLYEIKYYDLDLKRVKQRESVPVYNIKFLKHIKDEFLMETNKNNNKIINEYKNQNIKYQYQNEFSSKYFNPKYIYYQFNLSTFLVGRQKDNSFILLTNADTKSPEVNKYITESFVTVIQKSTSTSFLTGHFNGKISEWEISMSEPYKKDEQDTIISYKKISISYTRSLIAHAKSVNCIIYYTKYNILISSGLDNFIYIRKYYDFEMLCAINLFDQIGYELKINDSFLYALVYDPGKNMQRIKIYTLNGMEVNNSKYGLINNFDIDKNYIYVGYYDKGYIEVFDNCLDSVVFNINLDINEENIRKGLVLQNFFISPFGNNIIFCVLSNLFLLKIDISGMDKNEKEKESNKELNKVMEAKEADKEKVKDNDDVDKDNEKLKGDNSEDKKSQDESDSY